ncbi:sensor histidine kinase [Saxibacter everestensis]|uniref:histidine kinase n=1 Tax=Saxibacter everestensis TaxID=2909229 RepID=A0ABY8QSP6_9MICO|nr:sensor histidine kinase [Brevibacteriaceae bacterium ZFBP1038]
MRLPVSNITDRTRKRADGVRDRAGRKLGDAGSVRRWLRGGSLAQRILAWHVVAVLVTVGVTLGLNYFDVRTQNVSDAEQRARAVVSTLADTPTVIEGVQEPDPAASLQPYAARISADNEMDFITIMDVDRTRFTHSNPEQIGRKFIGTIGPALEGETFTETYAGTLGPSVRAVAPVRDANGEIVALVAAGVTVQNIQADVWSRTPWILLAGGAVLTLGLIGSWLTIRSLRRVTGDFGADDLSRMFRYYQSVLHSVREGLLLVEPGKGVVLHNDEASRLLGMPAGTAQGAPIESLGLPQPLSELLLTGREASDELFFTDTRVLVVSQQVARQLDGGEIGRVVTLRDHTDLQALTGELDSARSFADSLRAQTHEFTNRLHTIVSMIELGAVDEAAAFAAQEVQAARGSGADLFASLGDPVVSALLVTKVAQGRERGVAVDVDLAGVSLPLDVESRELVTILGNLLDNAFESLGPAEVADGSARLVRVEMSSDQLGTQIEVSDSGAGIQDSDLPSIFDRGWSTKSDHGATIQGRGLGLTLVRQSVNRLNGSIEMDSAAGDDPVHGELTGACFTIWLPRVNGGDRVNGSDRVAGDNLLGGSGA